MTGKRKNLCYKNLGRQQFSFYLLELRKNSHSAHEHDFPTFPQSKMLHAVFEYHYETFLSTSVFHEPPSVFFFQILENLEHQTAFDIAV